jgi:hypothetical protein
MAMTEITFSGSQYPQIQRFTLDASTANKAHSVAVPSSARSATVRFISNGGKLAFDTSADAISSDYIECTANTNNEFSLADGIMSAVGITAFYVASATTSTVCVVVVEG